MGKNIFKTFFNPQEQIILQGVSLAAQRGQAIAITGSSGAGKSTLLHILGTLDTPTSGTVEINGQSACASSVAQLRNQHIGFVFQNSNLLSEYTALENILMPLRIARTRGGEKRGESLLEKVGLTERGRMLAKQLSGGEKQRIAIARALCNDPDIILADEPTGNLDETNAKNIHELLLSSTKLLNKALIIVTHSRTLAAQCDVMYNLEGGHLKKL